MADEGPDKPKRRGRPPLPPGERKPELSGAEKKKRRNAADVGSHLAALKALGWKPQPTTAEESEDGAAEFAALGPPPLDDPETALAWVRRYQLTAMHLAASRPHGDALLSRLKLIDKFATGIGMTQNRVGLEELADRLEDSLSRARPAGAVTVQPTSERPRPPGSRGQTRGPRRTDG